MFFKRPFILIITALILLSACKSGYQKLYKGTDNEAKYAAALDYYDQKDYYRALQLFQQLINFYQGTEKSQKMQFYFAYCYYHQKDYVMAGYYFKRFTTNYPRSEYSEEASYMAAYCYYLDSPKYTLDQSNTITAINELQLFLNQYPSTSRKDDVNALIDELRNKLQLKDLNIAQLYFKMDRYEAAITSYNSFLDEWPDTKYKEEVIFNIMKSYYYYAIESIESKKQERFQTALDFYNELIFQFPDTKFLKEAENIRNSVNRKIEGDEDNES